MTDWSKYPEPWNWIGPQFRRECERIANDENLRARRLAIGLTQGGLGVIVGAAQEHVSRVELGEVAGETKQRIRAALDRLEQEREAAE